MIWVLGVLCALALVALFFPFIFWVDFSADFSEIIVRVRFFKKVVYTYEKKFGKKELSEEEDGSVAVNEEVAKAPEKPVESKAAPKVEQKSEPEKPAEPEKKTEPEQTVQEETPVENQMVAEEGTDTTTLASEQKTQETAQPEAHVKNDDPNEGKYKSYLSEARAAYNRANYDGALASLNKINALGKTYSNRKDVTGLRSQITSAKAAKDKKQIEEQDKKKKEEQKQKEIDQKCRSLFSNASAAYKNSNLDAADNYIRQIESLSPSYARRSEVTNLKANIKKSKANLNKWGL